MPRQSNVPPRVGLLLLETTYMGLPGALGHAETFRFPVTRKHVPGAVTDVIASDRFRQLTQTYVDSAQELAEGGAELIASNCGFSVAFQGPISEATGLPTFTSALLLAPLLNTVFAGRLAVLTYDARQIDGDRRRAAGWADNLQPPMADVTASAAWRQLSAPTRPDLDYEAMLRDLLAITDQLVAEHAPKALLLECTAMLPFESALYERTGLPVFGAPGFLHYLVDRMRGQSLADQVVKREG